MFVKYKKLLKTSIFGMFLYSFSSYGVSDLAIAFVDNNVILASQIGAPSIYTSFTPASLEDLIDFYALREKANRLSFINPSQIRIDEYKKSLIIKLGLDSKSSEEIDKEMKKVLKVDQSELNKSIVDFFKVYSLIETFVNSKVSSVHKSEVESYCQRNPRYEHPSFEVIVSENMSLEKYNLLKSNNQSQSELEKALGMSDSITITISATDIGADLAINLANAEINSLSSPIKSKKSEEDVFVVKVLSKSQKRLLTPKERYDEVSSIIMSENRKNLYEQILADARKECAIQYNLPKNKN